jgi:peroxiredoxin
VDKFCFKNNFFYPQKYIVTFLIYYKINITLHLEILHNFSTYTQMITFLRFCLVAFLLVSFQSINYANDTIQITCHLRKVEYNAILFSGVSEVVKNTEWEKEYAFPIDSNVTVTHKIFSTSPIVIRVTYDYRYFEVYAMPGDSLVMMMDGQIYPSEVTFSGKGAAQNRYLHQFRETFLAFSNKAIEKQMCISSPLVFRKYMDDVTAQKWAFFQKYKEKNEFTSDFSEFARAEIDYWRAYFLMRYYDEHLSILSGERYYIPDAYFDFLDDTKINNDNAFSQTWYRKFLKYYASFRLANLDFPHGLAARQYTVKANEADTPIFDAVDCARPLQNMSQKEDLLLLDKLTFPGQDGKPIAYRLKVKTKDGLIGWVKSNAVHLEKPTNLNPQVMQIENIEVNNYRDLITGLIKFDTLKLFADQDDRLHNSLMKMKQNERLILLNSSTYDLKDYKNEDILYSAPFTHIRSNRGIMGWTSTSGIQLQWKKSVFNENKVRLTESSKTAFDGLDYFFTGKALSYLAALNIKERLAFEGKNAVAPSIAAFLKQCQDASIANTVRDIFKNEDKRFYIDSSVFKSDRRLVSTRSIPLNIPSVEFKLLSPEPDQSTLTTLTAKKQKLVGAAKRNNHLTPLIFPEVKYNITPANITGKNRINKQHDLQLLVYPDLIHPNSRVIPIQTKKGKNIFQAKTFSLEVPVVEALSGVLISDKDSIPIFLQAGDEIELLSGDLGETQIECKGKSAGNFKYLNDVKKINQQIEIEAVNAAASLPLDFIQKINTLHDKKVKILTQNANYQLLTPIFLKLVESDIDYWQAFHLIQYASATIKKGATLPEHYYDFLDNLPIQNDFILPSEYYRKFVEIYLDEKLVKANRIETDEIARVHFGEKTLKYLQSRKISQLLVDSLDNISIEKAQYFLENNPFTIFNEMLSNTYQNQLTQQEGAIVPVIKMVNKKGKMVSLSDFKGKEIYVEFWNQQCTDWVKNIKTLKKRHHEFSKNKNVVFVYINTDQNIHTWKKTIKKASGIHLFQVATDLYGSRLDEALGVKELPARALVEAKGSILLSPKQMPSEDAVLTQLRAAIK